MSLQSPHARVRALFLALAVTTSAGCATNVATGPGVNAPAIIPQGIRPSARWIPPAGATYQIEYAYPGTLDTSDDASIYDVDYEDTSASEVAQLHAQGRRAICYISVGTWENWRADAKTFPKSVLGKPDGGWKGERWLDIRQTAILWPIMAKRFELCKQKGFDGADPDNIDGYDNPTGFKITAAQQLTYDEWVANEAHKLGLTVAQKNDNQQNATLSKYFDYGVDEQCWQQGYCSQMQVYTKRGALVVDVEYTPITVKTFDEKTCPSDAKYGIVAMLKHLSLDPWIATCPG